MLFVAFRQRPQVKHLC